MYPRWGSRMATAGGGRGGVAAELIWLGQVCGVPVGHHGDGLDGERGGESYPRGHLRTVTGRLTPGTRSPPGVHAKPAAFWQSILASMALSRVYVGGWVIAVTRPGRNGTGELVDAERTNGTATMATWRGEWS